MIVNTCRYLFPSVPWDAGQDGPVTMAHLNIDRDRGVNAWEIAVITFIIMINIVLEWCILKHTATERE